MCKSPEEQKIWLEHKLQVRRLWLDKVLLGLIIGATVFFASIYLENYKNSLNRDRFLLENRLTALRELRNGYSELSSDYFFLATATDKEKESVRNEYRKDLDEFMSIANKWSMLFSKRFEKQVRFHFWSHQAPAHDMIQLAKEHITYGSIIFEDFDNLTRIALWEETLGDSPREDLLMKFEDKGNVSEFFRENYEAWKTKAQEKHNH